MSHKIICRVFAGILFINLISWLSFAQPQSDIKLTQPSKPELPKTIVAAPVNNSPFQVGEKLSFNVSWANFVTAARLEMEVAGQGAFYGQQGYQLRTKVETLGYVRSLFTVVDNQYTSYIDAKTMLPYRADNATRQGTISDDDTINIDQQRRVASYADKSEIIIPSETFDLPSLVYALRARELVTGTKLQKFTALFGKNLVAIEAQVKQREKVTTQAGNYDAIRVDINAKTKDKTEYKVRIWFSDDSRHLPVLIISKPSFGEVRAELAQVSVKSSNGLNLVSVNNKPSEIASIGRVPLGVADVAPSEFENSLPFTVGERLSYDISWLNLGSVGKMNLAVQQRGSLENKIVFEMVGDVLSVGAARSIFNLNDSFKSYTRVDSLEPIKTETIIQEGKRRKQIVAAYHDNSVKLDNGTHFSVQPKTLDLVSMFYSIRAAQLTIGSSQTFNFVDANHRPHALTIKTVKTESINSALGLRETLQLDIFNQENNQLLAQAWLTNDARKLPVYIVARLSFGEIRIQLKTATNTR